MAQTPAMPTGTNLQLPNFGKWAIGIAGTWFGLAVLAEFDQTRALSVTLAWGIVGGMVLANGSKVTQALASAGFPQNSINPATGAPYGQTSNFGPQPNGSAAQ